MDNSKLCKYIIFSIIIFFILKYIPNIKLNNKDIIVLTILLLLILLFFDVNKNDKCKKIKEKMTEVSNNKSYLNYTKDEINDKFKDLPKDTINSIIISIDTNDLNKIIIDLNENNLNYIILNLNDNNLKLIIDKLEVENLNYLLENLSKLNKIKLLNLYSINDNELSKLIKKFNQRNINLYIYELYNEYLIKFINNRESINYIILLTNYDNNKLIINNLSKDNINVLINNLSTGNINILFQNLNNESIQKIFNNLNNNDILSSLNETNLEKIKNIVKPELLSELKKQSDNKINNILMYLHDDIKYDDIDKYIEFIDMAKYNPLYSKAIVNRTKIDNEFNVLIRLIETNKEKVLDLSKNKKLKEIVNEIVNEKKNELNKDFVNNNNDEELRTKKYIDTLIGKNKYFDNNGLVKNILDSDLKYSNLTSEQMEKLGEYDNTFSNNWQNDYVLLNTDKWRVPIGNQYKCKSEKTCPVCPSLTSGYPVNVRDFNNSRKILPPDNISVDYINDKLNK